MAQGRPAAVEIKGVEMPMIDDHAEEINGLQASAPVTKARANNVKEAHTDWNNARDASEAWSATRLFFRLVCSKVFIVVLFGVASVIHIYVLILATVDPVNIQHIGHNGAVHINDCPLDRRIPIYLIIVAVIGIGRALLNWYYRWYKPEGLEKPTLISSVGNLFWTAWLISGAAFCFGKEPNFVDPTNKRYCDKLTFYTAFVYIVIGLMFLLLALLMMGAIGGYMTCKLCIDKTPKSNKERRRQSIL